MSEVIPKERLTAFQRWEMASFDDAENMPESQPRMAAAALEQLHETARASGYSEGYVAGLAAGHAAMEMERQALQSLVAGVSSELGNVSHVLAGNVLDLALELSKAMLRQALAVDRERILPVIRETLASLPSVAQPAWLCLNPDDTELVGRLMQDELTAMGWKLKADARIERGGCRIETATSEVDATHPVRWQKIVKALGQESEWLA